MVAAWASHLLCSLATASPIRAELHLYPCPVLRGHLSLSDLCFGKTATLFEKGKDRYGRTLARVTCDGTDANAEQVRRGLAWAYTKYLTDPQIKVLEEEARASRLGLWHDDKSVPPWEWRKAKRT